MHFELPTALKALGIKIEEVLGGNEFYNLFPSTLVAVQLFTGNRDRWHLV